MIGFLGPLDQLFTWGITAGPVCKVLRLHWRIAWSGSGCQAQSDKSWLLTIVTMVMATTNLVASSMTAIVTFLLFQRL